MFEDFKVIYRFLSQFNGVHANQPEKWVCEFGERQESWMHPGRVDHPVQLVDLFFEDGIVDQQLLVGEAAGVRALLGDPLDLRLDFFKLPFLELVGGALS